LLSASYSRGRQEGDKRWNTILSFAPDCEVKKWDTLFPKSKHCVPGNRDTKRIHGWFLDTFSYPCTKWKKDTKITSGLSINVREYQRGSKNRHSRETGNIGHIRRRKTKQKHKKICVGHHCTQTNTNNVNKKN